MSFRSKETYYKYCIPYSDRVIMYDKYNIDLAENIIYHGIVDGESAQKHLQNDIYDFVNNFVFDEIRERMENKKDKFFVDALIVDHYTVLGKLIFLKDKKLDNIGQLLIQMPVAIEFHIGKCDKKSYIRFSFFDVFEFNGFDNMVRYLSKELKITRSWRYTDEYLEYMFDGQAGEYKKFDKRILDDDELATLDRSIENIEEVLCYLKCIREDKDYTHCHHFLDKSCANLHYDYEKLYNIFNSVNRRYHKGE